MDSFDLLIIGGGINGTAIARDAAGRGLSVLLVERDDLASHTSSASSKLIHGGLRYLEQREFRLVRESLHEREVLLQTAPHIVRPLRFILPDPPGGRPWWMIRTGLFLYGVLAGRRSSLPRPRGVKKDDKAVRDPLKPGSKLGEYWDAWADDSRLVALNAVAAGDNGAEIATRTELLSARREGDVWRANLSGGREVSAKILVNAAGPWVAETLHGRLGGSGQAGVRLVKGSHIAVPRLHDGQHAYILQRPDGRIVFVLPYGDLSLIGTTDMPVERPDDAQISAEETAYLCEAANDYFVEQRSPSDVVWSYAGIRALFDNGAADAKDVTRDYRLDLDETPGPKLLSVFGGKLTTARALATEALDLLKVPGLKTTRTTPLPGGDIDMAFNTWMMTLVAWMDPELLIRLSQAYGTRLRRVIEDAASTADLGRHFGADLYEAEVRYLVEKEFVKNADDLLWRRSKLGLKLSKTEAAALDAFITDIAAPKRKRIIGWRVDEGQRAALLAHFPPCYAQTVAHHVTLQSGTADPLPEPVEAVIVGMANDDAGVEALVVSIAGTTDRPDGSTYHITWSLEPGRTARESNEVIAAHGWRPAEFGQKITLIPALL